MFRVTEAAHDEIRRLLDGQDKPHGALRIRILKRSNTCGGTSFSLNFVEEPLAGELEVKIRNIVLLLDDETKQLLDDYVLDFNEGMFSGGFRFIDTTASNTCLCGKSIAV